MRARARAAIACLTASLAAAVLAAGCGTTGPPELIHASELARVLKTALESAPRSTSQKPKTAMAMLEKAMKVNPKMFLRAKHGMISLATPMPGRIMM